MDLKNIKKLNSKKEIKPITFQIKGKGSILVDDLFRIDYDTDVLIDVLSLIYELYKESNNYDSISKITFMLEKKLREINLDIRIYTFPSIKEARALLYAHEVELNEDDSYFDLFRKDIIA